MNKNFWFCVCVCVSERERERDRERDLSLSFLFFFFCGYSLHPLWNCVVDCMHHQSTIQFIGPDLANDCGLHPLFLVSYFYLFNIQL